MYCFIHNKVLSNAFCIKCKRPICDKCSANENNICPRCSNFEHQTMVDYNKKVLKYFIPFVIIRFMLYWDIFAIVFFSKENIFDYLLIIILLFLSYFPFIINVIKYGLQKSFKYQIIGKRNYDEIANPLIWKTFQTWLMGIFIFIIFSALMLVIIPMFIITDLIHLFILFKDYIYHKKRLLTETAVRNL